MKILVTGSEGYIGVILVQKLFEEGYDVVGLDTGFYRSAWLYPGVQKMPELILKDIRNVTVEDFKGIDAVVHLAELSNDPLGQNNPELTYKINHEGTMHFAKTAKASGVKRLVYSSSCSVYGASDNIADEKSNTNPLTAYAKCKLLNEQELAKLADDSFTPVFLRNATVFGASPRLRFDLVVNNLAGLAWTTKQIKMDSDGTPWRPFVHVKDAAKAITCALKAPKEAVHNQIFNVGNSRSNYQIKDIAGIVEKTFEGCSVTLNKDGADKRNYKVNFDKINTLLPGFSCDYDVAYGAQELLDIFKKVNLTTEDFNSRHYTRLKQIKYLIETNQLDEEFFWN